MSSQTGTVFKSTGSWYRVRLADGQFMDCRVRGKLRLQGLKTTNPVAVGDVVEVMADPANTGTGIITAIRPRRNYVMRRSVHKTDHGHLLAANIDQAMLMVTLSMPRTSYGFIDRFLVSTEAFRIPAFLIINKTDLYGPEEQGAMQEMIDIYEKIGVHCIPAAIIKNRGVEQIKKLLAGKTTLVAGHSGTGKSTLMNKLHPSIKQKIQEVSTFANKGVHTTTFAEMFEIAPATFVIDTPGIKELGLIDIGEDELADYFPEMRALKGACKFNNCRHLQEPQCAVRAAVEAGEIAASRYHSYLSMLADDDNRR